jgi:hypothetical protein
MYLQINDARTQDRAVKVREDIVLQHSHNVRPLEQCGGGNTANANGDPAPQGLCVLGESQNLPICLFLNPALRLAVLPCARTCFTRAIRGVWVLCSGTILVNKQEEATGVAWVARDDPPSLHPNGTLLRASKDEN